MGLFGKIGRLGLESLLRSEFLLRIFGSEFYSLLLLRLVFFFFFFGSVLCMSRFVAFLFLCGKEHIIKMPNLHRELRGAPQ
jgi:hypothetical protein